jgi:hypothetical protein
MPHDTDNGWTLTSLRALCDERDRRYGELAAAQARAVDAALTAAKEAVAASDRNVEKWQAAANEWRGAMQDREREFFSKSMGMVVGALSAASLIVALVRMMVEK